MTAKPDTRAKSISWRIRAAKATVRDARDLALESPPRLRTAQDLSEALDCLERALATLDNA
jgi:hypothetical protein